MASSQTKQIDTPVPSFPSGTSPNSCSISAASPCCSQHQRSVPSGVHACFIVKPRRSMYQRDDASMFTTPKNGTACLTWNGTDSLPERDHVPRLLLLHGQA